MKSMIDEVLDMVGFSNYMFVFLGGGIGASLRFILSANVNSHFNKIWVGTFFVNMLGCLIYYLSYKFFNANHFNMYALRVGMCGSLTTFSTFSFEIIKLIQLGNYQSAISVLLLNIVFGIVIGLLVL